MDTAMRRLFSRFFWRSLSPLRGFGTGGFEENG